LVDGKGALMHKSSACCPFGNKGIKFPHHIFAFGEKVRTKAVSARQTTCITPAQLVMSASNIDITDGKVMIDEWIPLQFNPVDAGK
jgi:ATP-dependent RNA helicase A